MIPCEYICTPMRAGAGEPAIETITQPRGGKLYNVPSSDSAPAHTGESASFSNGGTFETLSGLEQLENCFSRRQIE
jgi:hypothetical protein